MRHNLINTIIMPRITDFQLRECLAVPALYVHFEASMQQMADKVLEGWDELQIYMEEFDAITMDGFFVAYYGWRDMHTKPIRMSVLTKVAKPFPDRGNVVCGTLPAVKYVSCMFRGSYMGIKSVYEEMDLWVADHGMEATGDCYECYHNGAEISDEDYLTQVIFPLK